jgi:hypothetical protein
MVGAVAMKPSVPGEGMANNFPSRTTRDVRGCRAKITLDAVQHESTHKTADVV